MKTYRLFAAVCFTLLSTSSLALADVSEADRATARSLGAEGYEALQKQDYEKALDRFSRADSLVHAPTLLLGVARAQVGLGKWISAQDTYLRIIREGAAPGSPKPFFQALEDARKELDALTPRIPAAIIEVKGASEAEVTIDGAVVPSAALGVKRPVDPGKHVIRATAKGFVPAGVELTAMEGEAVPVMLEMKPPEAPKPIASPPPPPIGSPTPGDGADSPEKTSRSSMQKTLGLVALGIGGAGLLLGGVTGGLAVGKHGELSDACPNGECSPNLQGDLDSYHTLGTLSTVGFVVGGLGAAAGAVFLLTAPKETKRAGVSPFVGVGFVGAKGSF